MPNEVGCTLTMSGEDDELLEAAVQHAIAVHSESDSPELRDAIKASMTAEMAPA